MSIILFIDSHLPAIVQIINEDQPHSWVMIHAEHAAAYAAALSPAYTAAGEKRNARMILIDPNVREEIHSVDGIIVPRAVALSTIVPLHDLVYYCSDIERAKAALADPQFTRVYVFSAGGHPCLPAEFTLEHALVCDDDSMQYAVYAR